MKFWLRYDLRSPHFAMSTADLAAAALEQVAWADQRGFHSVQLSEHHGSPDGYDPSPLVFGAAIAARTRQLRIHPPMVLTLHDPVRFVEDCVMLDHISRGRLDLTIAIGYVPAEFALFGINMAERGRIADAKLAAIKAAFATGEMRYDGRVGRVTPAPFQSGGPKIYVGGGVPASAVRAARFGDGFYPLEDRKDLRDAYAAECAVLGKPAGPVLSFSTPVFFHLAEDPDAAWAQIAPHAMHEANSYAELAAAVGQVSAFPAAATADQLRATGAYRVMTPDDFLDHCRTEHKAGRDLIFAPMMGGLSPDLAWASLELFDTRVRPVLLAENIVDAA